MIELNPQLGRELRILAASPEFLRELICLREGLAERFECLIETCLLSLHTAPQGRQILNLIHVDELVPFKNAHLDNVVSLFEEYRVLTGEVR